MHLVLDHHAPPEQAAIAFEVVNLDWVQALCDRGYTLYPLNPKIVKSFRETLSAAGAQRKTVDSYRRMEMARSTRRALRARARSRETRRIFAR